MGNSSTAGSHCLTSSQASDSIPFPAQPQRLTGGLKTTVCAPKLSLLAFEATPVSSVPFSLRSASWRRLCSSSLAYSAYLWA